MSYRIELPVEKTKASAIISTRSKVFSNGDCVITDA